MRTIKRIIWIDECRRKFKEENKFIDYKKRKKIDTINEKRKDSDDL